ncbi:MAG: MBL fold metallo-hydrolase [Pseudomonadota bacterium]
MPARFDPRIAAKMLPGLPPPETFQGAGLARWEWPGVTFRLISDGAMTLPFAALAPDAPPAELDRIAAAGARPEYARGEITCALIDAGNQIVLVDTGAGSTWQSGAGQLIRNLAANAIAPETISHVVLTHMHADHAGGALTTGGAPAFPNARYIVGAAEHALWSQPGLADKVNPAFRDTVLGAQRVLRGLGDRVHAVKDGDAIIPGLTVMDTPGHSPGHISLMLDAGPGIILTGDALIHDRISFECPDWAFGFDADADLARVSRRRLLDLAVSSGHLMSGVHWKWPGLGHAVAFGDAFRFVPFD